MLRADFPQFSFARFFCVFHHEKNDMLKMCAQVRIAAYVCDRVTFSMQIKIAMLLLLFGKILNINPEMQSIQIFRIRKTA